MKFSSQQEIALSMIQKWIETRKKPFFYLAGYAGTGKTTLAKYIGDSLPSTKTIYYAAFTGKAAHRLKQMGCQNPQTIHSLIYSPAGTAARELEKLRKELEVLEAVENMTRIQGNRINEIVVEIKKLDKPSFSLNDTSLMAEADLVIIDESSMIDEYLANDLLSFRKPLLVLGDPAQLPPVGKPTYFSKLEPDYFLTEIHRQALENPIIALSKKIREGGDVEKGDFGAVRSINISDMKVEDLLDYDQIITGQNATRRALNKRIRKQLGYEGVMPVVGDKLVCLKNNKKKQLFNGTFCTVLEAPEPYTDSRTGANVPHISEFAYKQDDGERVWRGTMHDSHFIEYERPEFASRFPRQEKWDCDEFDYGYALTVHKSQGSEWDRLLVVDDQFCKRFPKERRKWLYTAVTRAKEQLTVAECAPPLKVRAKPHLERSTKGGAYK